MKLPALPVPIPHCLMLSGALWLAVSCASQHAVEDSDPRAAGFALVRPVLERNCVHCHGAERLPGMPSLVDTQALASLIGPDNLIVPGQPEQSRFFTVVTLADHQTGAMPPTGHALTRREVATLRDWIQEGAAVPSVTTKLVPEGTVPRSR